ncbi:MAG: hypothetical protein WA416_18130 [Candidatus Sulfotelmatobacter sp.]
MSEDRLIRYVRFFVRVAGGYSMAMSLRLQFEHEVARATLAIGWAILCFVWAGTAD